MSVLPNNDAFDSLVAWVGETGIATDRGVARGTAAAGRSRQESPSALHSVTGEPRRARTALETVTKVVALGSREAGISLTPGKVQHSKLFLKRCSKKKTATLVLSYLSRTQLTPFPSYPLGQ